jgi:hypothetical protein
VATAYLPLMPNAAAFPDGSASNLSAALIRYKGSEAAPSKHFFVLAFDGAGALEHAWYSFPMPGNYASGGTLKINWRANATSGNVKWQAKVGASSAGDTDTLDEHALAAAATVTTAANTTEAKRQVASSITLTMDSAAADDHITLDVFRDSADGSDTCTVDAEITSMMFEYVTT